MEKVFVYGFPVLFVSLWLVAGLRRKGGPGAGALMAQFVPAILVEAMILLDDCLSPDGIPVSLLASDFLFLDALMLQMVGPAARGKGLSLSIVFLASAGLVKSVLDSSLLVPLLLVLVYVFLQIRVSFGTLPFKVVVMHRSGKARNRKEGPDPALEESRRIDILFEKVENYMQTEKPYLDDMFSESRLAMEMMTNKTMLSKAINDKSGKNFCRYVNSYRIRHAVSLMKRDKRLKVGELSLMSGFHTVASFNMAFKLFMNDTPSEYMRTLHSKGLATRAGEGPRDPPRYPLPDE